MIKEYITSYLKDIYLKVCHSNIKNTKITKKVVYLASFPDNHSFWLEDVITKIEAPFYIACTKTVAEEINHNYSNLASEIVLLDNSYHFFKKTLPLIASAQVIIADNYFPFLAAFPKKEGQHIVQIWHADGAIKKFGMEDPKIQHLSKRELIRYTSVYQSFTDYIVASSNMGEIFINSYLAKSEQLHYLGYPRSDLYNAKFQERLKMEFYELNNFESDKPLWLYAPTYRLEMEEQSLDVKALEKEHNIQIIEKYHPHSKQISTVYKGTLPMLLAAVDGIITDYSSLPFDYALLHQKGQIIYYQYDLADYQQKFGLQNLFEPDLSGMVVTNKRELGFCLEIITPKDFTEFNQAWNTYNDGKATIRFVKLINNWLEEGIA